MDKIDHLLTRGVDTIYPSREALEKVLRSGKKLRLYQGFDPTGTRLHIGHAVALRKMRQFQDLGHKVIFLIGDFTAVIGDPSGKSTGRPLLSKEQVLENARDYQNQVSKILRFEGENPVTVKFNSEWLSKLGFADVLQLASHFTVQQIIERDMFQQRLKNNNVIGLQEFLYPLMVGYDSVAMDVDLELGGTDQTFNMLAGRKLVEQMLHKEKFVLTVPLLADARGIKIGKTEGNAIGLSDLPNDFYGKIMSLGDDAIVPCLTLLTDTPITEIEEIKKKMGAGENPMTFKKQLAFELTKQFNDEAQAQSAQTEFETRFQKGALAEANLPVTSLKSFTVDGIIIDDIVTSGLAASKSDARRLIDQKAVQVNGKVITDPKEKIQKKPGDVFKAGRKAVKIIE